LLPVLSQRRQQPLLPRRLPRPQRRVLLIELVELQLGRPTPAGYLVSPPGTRMSAEFPLDLHTLRRHYVSPQPAQESQDFVKDHVHFERHYISQPGET
jgi:hypothetical protein